MKCIVVIQRILTQAKEVQSIVCFLKNRDYFMNRDYSQTITTMILKVITYKTSFMISLVSFPINNRVNI